MIPKVHWTIEGSPIYLEDDWRATTIANGGFNTFSGRLKADVARGFTSTIDQGAIVRGFQDNGRLMFEGRMTVPPYLSDGYARIEAGGHKLSAEDAKGRLLYQSRAASLWADAAGAPYPNPVVVDGVSRSNASTIGARAEDGMLVYEITQGTTVAQNDGHRLNCHVPGSLIRRVACALEVTGTATGYALRVYTFDGPDGAVTTNGSMILSSGDKTITITSPTDAIAIGLVRTDVAETRATPLVVRLRFIRVNDIAAEDSMEVSEIVSDVGERLGFDVTGIPVGGSNTNIIPAIQAFTPTFFPPTSAPWEWEYRPMPIQVSEQAVVTTGLNALPQDWQQGSWAAFLDYLSTLLDFRWRVLGDYGNGPLLQFGPWAGSWGVQLASNATVDLRAQERFNKVIVKYPDAAGKLNEIERDADPDPLAFAGITKTWEESISDIQEGPDLATRVADKLIERLPTLRYRGTMQIVGAHDEAGRGSCYDLIAGDNVTIKDVGPSESMTLRVTETEMTSQGTNVGIEQNVSVASEIALAGLARLRNPFGTIVRYPHHDGGHLFLTR